MASRSPPQLASLLAMMSDGSHFSYFDTGAPSGVKPYETYLCIPDAMHNMWTWKDMVKTKPPSARLIAFTLRGYDGSASFTDEDLATGQTITAAMGRDFISMVIYVVGRLAVLSTQGSCLTILSWGLGAAFVMAGYGTLLNADPLYGPAPSWPSYISKIVFYEPAGDLALGLGMWTAPTTKATPSTTPFPFPPPSQQQQQQQEALSLPQRKVEFARYLSGYYQYTASIFSAPAASATELLPRGARAAPGTAPRETPGGTPTTTTTHFLFDSSPLLRAQCLNGIYDASPFLIYPRMRWAAAAAAADDEVDDVENQAYACKALVAMVGAGAGGAGTRSGRSGGSDWGMERRSNGNGGAGVGVGVARVHAISTLHAPPSVMSGVRWLRAVMGELEEAVDRAAALGKKKEQEQERFRLTWILGDECNHYVHNTAPERLWGAILEENGDGG